MSFRTIPASSFFPLIRFYIVLATIVVILSAFITPPFMVADESNHFFRAVQLSQGGLVGRRLANGWAGGMLPQPVLNFGYGLDELRFDQTARADGALMRAVRIYHWQGNAVPANFPNTALYPPQFYLPGALALSIARQLHLSVLSSFYAARIASGLFCVGISALALRLCAPQARLWLVFCLSLPEVLGLYGSLSQDGPFIACAVLACALLSRCRLQNRAGEIAAAVFLLALFVSAKPPYLAVLFLPLLLVDARSFKFTLALVAVSFVAVLCWCFWGLRPLAVPLRHGDVSPLRQMHHLIVHPLLIGQLLYHSFILGGPRLLEGAIATTGWVDVLMPRWYYALWLAAGLLAAGLYAVNFLQACQPASLIRLGLLLALVFAAGAGVSLSIYLTWDDVGQNAVQGLLGRYFTALAVFLAPGAVFAAPARNAAPSMALLSRVLLYGFLPFGTAFYLLVLAQRFWWPG